MYIYIDVYVQAAGVRKDKREVIRFGCQEARGRPQQNEA